MRFQPGGFQRYDHTLGLDDLLAAWAAGPDDVWLAGGGGTILRYHAATGWRRVESGTTTAIFGLWGSGPNDVWAVGMDGIILRWNGTAWAPVASGTKSWLRSVWGSGPNDVWAVGADGVIDRWDGANWTPATPAANVGWSGVWGSSASDVWVTAGVYVWHWNGTKYDSQVTMNGGGVWGRSSTEVYVWNGTGVQRWNGKTWNDLRLPAPPGALSISTTLGGGATGDVWVGVWGGGAPAATTRWNGSAWSPYENVTRLGFDGLAVTSTDVWGFGRGGMIMRHAP
jgi:hypothetical protein